MTAAAPRRKLPSWAPQAMGYCLSAVCLFWVLHNYQFNQLIPAIRSLDWWWVSAAVLCDLSVYFVHAFRWNTLLEPVAKLRLLRTVQSIYIGLFANEVLPLRVGELIRCYLLAHWNGLNLSVAFASAALERVIDGFWMLAAFLITTMFVKKSPRISPFWCKCWWVAADLRSDARMDREAQTARAQGDSRDPVGRRAAPRSGGSAPDGQSQNPAPAPRSSVSSICCSSTSRSTC